jgi:UDPglucose 6-dehydrogenase
MNIAVIGSGYVGLVTGTCLAETGNNVTCVDIDKAKVARMQKGQVPIYEPELDELFSKNIKAGKLHFTTDLAKGVKNAKVVFLALPTPQGADGEADLSYVLDVADKLSPLVDHYMVVVTKSTVPVGTAEKLQEKLSVNAKADFDIVSNPEFLREGLAIQDFMNPDRIVIGTQSEKAQKILAKLYAPYVKSPEQIMWMSQRSSEMTKYAANSFLAAKVSYINEIANLCELVGADIDSVCQGIGSDDRIGHKFLKPGIGYGGSCFPKDVTALIKIASNHNCRLKMLESIVSINDEQKKLLVKKLLRFYKDDLKGKKIALWGIAFKPDTDDIREAPALSIIRELNSHGAIVIAYDPQAMDNAKSHFSDLDSVNFALDHYAAIDDADALLVVTEWKHFYTPDISRMSERMKNKVIFDGRNIFLPETLKIHGFHYEGIGRKVMRSASTTKDK